MSASRRHSIANTFEPVLKAFPPIAYSDLTLMQRE
jgi:hypothetical protein